MSVLKKSFVIAGLSTIAAAGWSQTTVWPTSGGVDTFEYADNAAAIAAYGAGTFQAGYGISTEQNASAAGTKSLKIGDADNINGGFAPITDAAGTSTTATFYYYDTDAAYTGANRTGLSFGGYSGGAWGSGTLSNYLILGLYSSTGGSTTNYSRRITFGGDGYQATSVPRSTGWHRMQISASNGTVEFGIDGVVGSTGTYTVPSTGWNAHKLGAIAGTDNMDVYFDDYSVVTTGEASVDAWHMY